MFSDCPPLENLRKRHLIGEEFYGGQDVDGQDGQDAAGKDQGVPLLVSAEELNQGKQISLGEMGERVS